MATCQEYHNDSYVNIALEIHAASCVYVNKNYLASHVYASKNPMPCSRDQKLLYGNKTYFKQKTPVEWLSLGHVLLHEFFGDGRPENVR